MWLISIADDGPGVPNGMKEKIFDRFVKIGKEKGMGLGLSLARAIVEKFGGRIWVEDRPAGVPGSIFKVLLQRAK